MLIEFNFHYEFNLEFWVSPHIPLRQMSTQTHGPFVSQKTRIGEEKEPLDIMMWEGE